MSEITLTSGQYSAVINDHGAELRSFKKADKEYMWQADPAFWARTSPVLFPFVGAVNEGKFYYKEKAYPMGQHGFARDMDFTLVEKTENTCLYTLSSNDETLAKYPLPFTLTIGYELRDNALKVLWKVENPGTENLEFSIGAHPAFNCTLEETTIRIMKNGMGKAAFNNSVFGKGLLTAEKKDVPLEDGYMKLHANSFDGDAFVIEDGQTDCVEILDDEKNKILSVSYTSPLVGIWSPPTKNAPFLCIEPWYGRADMEGFQGELKDRAWNNTLKPGEVFEESYSICVF